MNTIERKNHWEKIFQTKDTKKVSWYQPVPETSLKIIQSLKLPQSAKIIDVGCGDSYLPDFLVQKGFTDITVVDISESALQVVKNRLAEKVNCINTDITCFIPDKTYDVWHDRAVFHFLNEPVDIQIYVETVSNYISQDGYLILGTFSENGPDQCSGLHVHQYSENELTETFENAFNKIQSFTENHTTPSGGCQNFLFCLFQRKK